MQAKRKRLLITISVIVLFLIAVSITFSLLFRLKTVNVAFISRLEPEYTNIEAGILDEVKKDGDFSYGKNTLLMKFNSNIENIESKHPFVKVEKIVKHFPNKVTVYISERLTKYRVISDTNDKYFILDDEFKVLDIVDTSDIKYNEYTTEILSNTLTISADYKAGDFVDEKVFTQVFKEVMSGVYAKIAGYYYIDKIEMPTENSLAFEIKDSKTRVEIETIENLKEKVAVALECYLTDVKGNSALDETHTIIKVAENEDGRIEARVSQNNS